MMDYGENLQKCQEYVKALEEEKRKIEMFQRELPLCLELISQAIETYKRQLPGSTAAATTITAADQCLNGQSECSEQTASDGPVLEEFIPIKRPTSSLTEEDEEELESHHHIDTNNSSNDNSRVPNNDFNYNNKPSSDKKIDWLRSVQLWNQSSDTPENHRPRKVQVVEVKSSTGGAFHPFQRDKNPNNIKPVSTATATTLKITAHAISASSSAERAEAGVGGGSSGSTGVIKKEDGSPNKDAHPLPRKSRRCWSPELHKKFLNALHQLGGSHVATPKQIRELMRVDGLTNDEVKSHLQKYRLHTRRPTPAIHSNVSAQAPQFVVVGGIWVPPTPEYAAVAPSTTSSTTNPATLGGETASLPPPLPHGGIYTPVAAAPDSQVSAPHHHHQCHQEVGASTTTDQQEMKQSSQSQSEERGSQSNGSCSSPTSSSTHMTTSTSTAS